MARWFWYFMLYSFLGFVLEVLFARAIRNPKRDRKCFYFLPLCPVYGLGALAILALPDGILRSPLLLLPCAALLCTAVEYLTGLFYEKAAGVSFWDYSHLPLNLQGRVCLLFAAIWGVLALAAVYLIHPGVEALTALLPGWLTLPAALFLALDAGFTLYVLRREGSTDALRWYLHVGRRARRLE